MLRKIVDLITSLKLTIVCLAAAMALIFAGTIAQVHLGIHEAQQRYFQSLFVWWPPESRGFKIPIFPGGHLIGAVLLINLIAAHAKRFHWAWRKLGIHLTHAGLIIMLAGGLFTDLFAVESHMRLANGDTKNYSENARSMELAVIDTTDPEFDQVTAIPEALLRQQANDRASKFALPDRRPEFFPELATAKWLSESGERRAGRSQIRDQARKSWWKSVPRATGVDDRDVVSAAIEIVPIEFASGAISAAARHLAGFGCARCAANIFVRRTAPGRSRCVRRATTNRTA